MSTPPPILDIRPSLPSTSSEEANGSATAGREHQPLLGGGSNPPGETNRSQSASLDRAGSTEATTTTTTTNPNPAIVLPNEVPDSTSGCDADVKVRIAPSPSMGATTRSPAASRALKKLKVAAMNAVTAAKALKTIDGPEARTRRAQHHHHHRKSTAHHGQHHSEHSSSSGGGGGGSSSHSSHPYRFGWEHGHHVSFCRAIVNAINHHWVLSPFAPWRPYWNFIIFIILIYYIIEIPLRLGFKIDTCNECVTTILHLLCDIFFMFDCLCVSTRTTYYLEDSNHTILETSPRKIWRRYLKSWFFFDLLTSLPFHHILSHYYDMHDNVVVSGVIQFTYLARMLKPIRFMELLQYYHSVELSAGTVWSDLLKIFKFIFGFFVIAHMSACMWMFIALAERIDDRVPAEAALWPVMTWPGNLGYTAAPNMTEVRALWSNYSNARLAENRIFDEQSQAHLVDSVVPFTVDLSYLMALYWSVSTMTTVGFGDILPRNDIEIIYACLVIFIGAVTFGYIISNVSSIIQIEDDADTKIRDKITSINAYMAYRKLPPDLQKKIRHHYEYQWKRKTVYDEKSILQNLPTHLRTRVALYLNQDLIRNVAFLRDLGSDCLALLVTELRPFRVGAGYWIFKQGSLGSEMCFIHDGTVEVLGKKNKQLAILERGAYFGEHSILSSRPTRRSASVRALTTTDLFGLTKESFEEVLKIYPELREEVVAHAEARLREAIQGKTERDYERLVEVATNASVLEGNAPITTTADGTTAAGAGVGGLTRVGASSRLLGGLSTPNSTRRALLMTGGRSSGLGLTLGLPTTPQFGPIVPSTGTPATAATGGAGRLSSATLGFNPYLSLPHSKQDDAEDENAIRRTVLKGKEQLEVIMHPELADEIRQESAEAEAILDAQIEAEQQFLLANVGFLPSSQRQMMMMTTQNNSRLQTPVTGGRRLSTGRSFRAITDNNSNTTNTNPTNTLNDLQTQSLNTFVLDRVEPSNLHPTNLEGSSLPPHVTPQLTPPIGGGPIGGIDGVGGVGVGVSPVVDSRLSTFLSQLSSHVSSSLSPVYATQSQLSRMQRETRELQDALEELLTTAMDYSQPETWKREEDNKNNNNNDNNQQKGQQQQ